MELELVAGGKAREHEAKADPVVEGEDVPAALFALLKAEAEAELQSASDS